MYRTIFCKMIKIRPLLILTYINSILTLLITLQKYVAFEGNVYRLKFTTYIHYVCVCMCVCLCCFYKITKRSLKLR